MLKNVAATAAAAAAAADAAAAAAAAARRRGGGEIHRLSLAVAECLASLPENLLPLS